jgi:peptide chain release factor 1
LIHLPQAKLDQVMDRFRMIEARMGAATDGAEIVRLSKEHAEIKPVCDAVERLIKARNQVPELEELAAMGDPELSPLAEEELAELKVSLPDLERGVALLLAPKDKDENASAILEVRAGTGGDEAALFAGDLFRMYSRYAERKRWKVEIMNLSESSAGGIKEAVAMITAPGGGKVFSELKYESGVHRVQRVPETEAQGRIHTSAATVAVLPEAEEVDVKIEDKDLRIEVMRSGGPGGQSVNTTDSAVQIMHIPTGIIVRCQQEKSQHKNRATAMRILRSKLLEIEREKQETAERDARRAQVKSGDRSEKIRTYNFPQDRITDHRIGLTKHNLPKIMDGDLQEIIDSLRAFYQTESLRGEA